MGTRRRVPADRRLRLGGRPVSRIGPSSVGTDGTAGSSATCGSAIRVPRC